MSNWVLHIYHLAVATTLLCRSCYQSAARFSNVLANGCYHFSICAPPVLTKRCYQFAVVRVTYLQMGDISLQIARYYVVARVNTKFDTLRAKCWQTVAVTVQSIRLLVVANGCYQLADIHSGILANG